MISTWADLFFALLPFGTGIFGYAIGRAAAFDTIRKREARRRELTAQCRHPLDLSPADFAREDWV